MTLTGLKVKDDNGVELNVSINTLGAEVDGIIIPPQKLYEIGTALNFMDSLPLNGEKPYGDVILKRLDGTFSIITIGKSIYMVEANTDLLFETYDTPRTKVYTFALPFAKLLSQLVLDFYFALKKQNMTSSQKVEKSQ